MSKTYAVTGVASGIGAELARTLKKSGHTVVGFDLHEAHENVDVFIRLDLNDEAAIIDAANQVGMKLDGLCNNAGLPPREGLEAAILQVNFLGTRAFTLAMLPHLNTGASIVNMASRAGHGWRDNIDQIKRLAQLNGLDQIEAFIASEVIDATRCYNLSKEAMILWTIAETEAMIQAGFRVNSLSPGAIATGILGDFKKAFGAQMAKNVERAGRAGKPEEIAEIAAFMLSEQSNWLKGTDIAIDGGMGAFNMSDALRLNEIRLTNQGNTG